MSDRGALLAHQFHDLRQQREASELGMWVFLATEVLMFGGIVTAFLAVRGLHAEAFVEGSRHLDWRIGAANTAVLITSSLTMALGVHFARGAAQRATVASLGATALLGLTFLAVKAVEYAEKWSHGQVPGRWFRAAAELEMFYAFYFVLTGLHGLHMAIGVGVIGTMMARAARGTVLGEGHMPVEVAGLYWHLVDVVWIFLFPLLYLSGGIRLG